MTPAVEALKDRLSHQITTLRTEIEDKRVEQYLCERERRELMLGKTPREVCATLEGHEIVLA